jgi:predicted permease
MILTGFVIGGYSIKGLLGDKKVYIATGLRLFVLPALIVGFLKLIGASDLALTMALFAYATPLGLNTVIFPAAYGGDTKPGAAMAMISHTVCVLTIPLMYVLLNLIL